MFDVKPTAGALGAEISNVDLGSANPATYKKVRELLLQYEVIFFRDQDITPAQQKALAQSFGPLQTHPAYGTVEGFPEITILESTPEKPTKIECWHSDMTFRQNPPLGTVLLSKIIPEKGGDTLWSSTTAAYLGLSDAMQSFLSGLEAEHSFEYGFKESLAESGGPERLAQALKDNPPVRHPVIHTHPETGKKVIFVNRLFTTHIVGMKPRESQALLEFLYQHIVIDEYTTRFQWSQNAIALWDNRSTQHKPINDYFPAHRLLNRITIDGDKPY